MEDFDLTGVPEEKAMGLGSSKCALAIKEKLSVFQSMLNIAEALINPSEFGDDEFFRQMIECTMEKPRESSARTLKSAKPDPAAKKQKKQTRP